MVKNLFDRYIWLVDTIYRAGKITYKEINRKWLRTDWSEDKDLRTLPLHTSQQEIEVKDEYSVFSYYVSPTTDFTMELLSYGSSIEVISPKQLRSEIAEIIKKMYNFYK